MNTGKVDLNTLFRENQNQDLKKLTDALSSSLMKLGYQLSSEATKRALVGDSFVYQIEFNHSVSARKILLKYYTQSFAVSFFIKNGQQEMDFSSYLACEHKLPIIYPTDFNNKIKMYYEEELVRFLTHLSDPIIVDILEGKTWKEWRSTWGQERQ